MAPQKHYPKLWIGLAAWVSLSSTFLWADDPTIRILDRWTNVFGESRASLRVSVSSSEDFAGRLIWRLSSNSRTLARGESAHELKAKVPLEVVLGLDFPRINEGLTIGTQLEVSLLPAKGDEIIADSTRQFWVYSSDPFVDRAKWLEGLRITLFDPTGKTAEVFTASKIPCRQVRSAAALAAEDTGLVIVGEGSSLKNQRELAGVLATLASRGRRVLCLAPTEGSIDWDDLQRMFEGDGTKLEFARGSALAALDKRFDTESWLGPEPVVVSGFHLASLRNRVTLNVAGGSEGWPFVSLSHPSGGRLLLVGFGIIRGWKSSPTPRYALARWFELLADEGPAATESQPLGIVR